MKRIGEQYPRIDIQWYVEWRCAAVTTKGTKRKEKTSWTTIQKVSSTVCVHYNRYCDNRIRDVIGIQTWSNEIRGAGRRDVSKTWLYSLLIPTFRKMDCLCTYIIQFCLLGQSPVHTFKFTDGKALKQHTCRDSIHRFTYIGRLVWNYLQTRIERAPQKYNSRPDLKKKKETIDPVLITTANITKIISQQQPKSNIHKPDQPLLFMCVCVCARYSMAAGFIFGISKQGLFSLTQHFALKTAALTRKT